MTDRDICLKLIASLTLADHMGDVHEDIDQALKLLGTPYDRLEFEKLSDLGTVLGRLGITTLWDTKLGEDQ